LDKYNLAWNSTSPINNQPNSYELANTSTDPASVIGQSAIITLNTKMLQNSSQLIIASVAIHETLHAYIKYNIATAEDNVRNNYNDYGSWFAALDAFYTVRNLPSNYSDHYQMLTDYFDKSVSMLSAWDNNAHNINDYRMAALYGLNTVDANCPATLKATLDNVYNNLVSKFGFTASALSTFNNNQLNAPNNQKLPTSGCN
jgi:hypothetical protein